MKILLIAPPDNKYALPFVNLPTPPTPIFSGFPLGLGYIAAMLIKDGHQVKILDCLVLNQGMPLVSKTVKSFKPDIVGITTMTHYIKSAVQVADLVKSINNKTIIIGGGPHVNFEYKKILTNYQFDYIVLGEGEISFSNLINYLAKNKKSGIEKILGIAYKKNNNIKITPPQPLIKNLDDLPFPARNLVNFNDYIVDQLLPNAVEIVGSRGCSHCCAFCSSSHFWKYWRSRSPENIIKEMKQLLKKYPKIESFLFYDDNFTVNKERVKKLCHLLIKEGLNKYKWNCQARADQVDEQMLALMKKAGVSKINFGVETGSPKVLKNIDKRLDFKNVLSAIKISKKLGIEALVYFMIGNPGESVKTIKESIAFAKKLKPTSSLWSVAQILPGTKLAKLHPISDYVNYLYEPEVQHPYPYTWSFIPVFENKGLNREKVKYYHLRASRYFAFYHLLTDPISKIKHILVSPTKSFAYFLSLVNRQKTSTH